MKKIVSIALFGNADKYGQHLSAFVRAHLNLFPLEGDWKLRVYLDEPVLVSARGQALRRAMTAELLDIRIMPTAPLTRAMLWRMAPIFDDGVDFVFCRDLDACPLPRDRRVCEEFMLSRCAVHTVHDHEQHCGIMGGLSGFWAPEFCSETGFRSLQSLYIAAELIKGTDWGVHGTDQIVLNKLLLTDPMVKLLEHRYNGWVSGAPTDARRTGGYYQCQAWSTPTPNDGVSKFSGELAEQAERLAPHMGAAGFDHEAAVKFYNEHGDQEIARRVKDCGL